MNRLALFVWEVRLQLESRDYPIRDYPNSTADPIMFDVNN
jgi:hypothetical protein